MSVANAINNLWVLEGLRMNTAVKPKSGWWLQTKVAGFDLGTAEADRVVLASLLPTGQDVRIQGYGNRLPKFTIQVHGYTDKDVAEGERALNTVLTRLTESRRGGSLLFGSPDGRGATTLYHVRIGTMGPGSHTTDEIRRWFSSGRRWVNYDVQLEADPSAYSTEVVEQTFTIAAASDTTRDDCTDATNWPGFTAGTYLGETVVSSPAFIGDGAAQKRVPIQRTGAITAGNYLWVELAVENGTLQLLRHIQATTGLYALAVVPQTNKFTRIYFPFQSPLNMEAIYQLTDPWNTAGRLHINKIGTATVLPSTSLFSVHMAGSVSVLAALEVTSSSGPLGEVMVYADPTMAENGWDPGTPSTWVNAPQGEYMVWVNPDAAYVGGVDRFKVTIGGIEGKTIAPAHAPEWFPVGPFFLGQRRDRRLGTAVLNPFVQKNDVVTPIDAELRLFREDSNTGLNYIRDLDDSAEQTLWFDPSNFDSPMPGIFVGNNTAGPGAAVPVGLRADATGDIRLVPEVTTIYAAVSGDSTPTIKVRQRAAFNTRAAV